jgi:hypothetical protein
MDDVFEPPVQLLPSEFETNPSSELIGGFGADSECAIHGDVGDRLQHRVGVLCHQPFEFFPHS